jgi:hypothetical protein
MLANLDITYDGPGLEIMLCSFDCFLLAALKTVAVGLSR